MATTIQITERDQGLGGFTMVGNSTETTIATQNVWVKMAGTTVDATNMNLFSSPSDNRITFIGLEPCIGTLQVAITGNLPSRTTSSFQFAIFKNGSIITNTITERYWDDQFPYPVSLNYLIDAAEDDYYEVFTRNITGTVNFIAETLILSVLSTSDNAATVSETGTVLGLDYEDITHGGLTMTGNATETSITQNVWVKVAGTTVDGDFNGWTSPSDNRLTNGTAIDQVGTLSAVVSVIQSSGAGLSIDFAIAKNGSVVTSTVMEVYAPTATVRTVPILTPFDTSNTDYYEIWVRNTASGDNITAKSLMFNVNAIRQAA